MQTSTIQNIATPIETWVNPNHTIQQGCSAIQNQKSHVILLGKPNAPMGIVSAGDVVNAIANNIDIANTPLSEIATTNIATINENSSLTECLKMFQETHVRCIFVTHNNNITSIISKNIILSKHSEILDLAIAEATAKLQETADNRDELLGTAAHDIRNPLGVILAWCELFEDIFDDQISLEISEGLETIKKQATHILEILNQFLDVSKIESGKVHLHITEFDPAEIILSAYKSNLIRAQKKMIPLENDAPLTMPLIKGDRDRIQSTIYKLIQNAIKYSKAGELIRIKAYNEEDKLKIEIIDSGQGIPLEEQERIFTAFAKTSTRPTAGETSTGLGLAIAKKIIEIHQGKLKLTSEPGKGSIFTIELPNS